MNNVSQGFQYQKTPAIIKVSSVALEIFFKLILGKLPKFSKKRHL